MIRRKSNKQSSIDRKLKKVYRQLSETRRLYCTGCGTTDALTHSHLIPRSRRRDLVCEIENITYHCVNCHTKWENGVLANELYDYRRNMEYLKRVDNEYFHIREGKLEKNNN
jgi:5-methylcytosine-specific restriction endonuclease McrA